MHSIQSVARLSILIILSSQLIISCSTNANPKAKKSSLLITKKETAYHYTLEELKEMPNTKTSLYKESTSEDSAQVIIEGGLVDILEQLAISSFFKDDIQQHKKYRFNLKYDIQASAKDDIYNQVFNDLIVSSQQYAYIQEKIPNSYSVVGIDQKAQQTEIHNIQTRVHSIDKPINKIVDGDQLYHKIALHQIAKELDIPLIITGFNTTKVSLIIPNVESQKSDDLVLILEGAGILLSEKSDYVDYILKEI